VSDVLLDGLDVALRALDRLLGGRWDRLFDLLLAAERQESRSSEQDDGHEDLNDRSISELLQRLSQQTQTLVRDEIALAKAELTEKGKHAGIGVGLFGGGGVLALYGVGTLLITAAAALALVWAAWLAALTVAVVVFAVFGFLPWLRWIMTSYVVTNERVLIRQGVLTRTGRDIPLNRVNDISFHHSLPERLIGSGTLTIESAGERGQLVLRSVPRVEHVHSTLYELGEALDLRRRAGSG